MKQNYISKSEKDTIGFAKEFARHLTKEDIIVLTGELGSGKTKFTQGILEFFHLEDEISSPTFTIVNEYQNQEMNIYHFDVYRLASSDEFLAIGGEEYFGNGICIIEWGEIIEDLLPPSTIYVRFEKDAQDENIRKIQIETKNVKKGNEL